ncbi:MAG TPA: lamin tail domain-containing protein, partial [Lacipirellulaceae bacterium]|nr:lamin tail domain-containing protein [Lacipirellulaceae bacterium]
MLAADLVISEFLASSSGGLADEDGDFPDWIELHNRGASDAHLAGWYLTDNASNLAKWQLPAVTLQPDEYLVVFASGKDRTVVGGELHANFSLSAAGEYLGLVMPDGQTVVHAYSPAFPPQGRDVSYGLGEIAAQYDYVGPGSTVQTVVPVNSSYDAVWQLPEYVPDGNWFTGTVGVGFGDFVNGFTVRNYKAAPGVQVSSIVVAEDVVSDPSLYTSVVSGNFGTINFSNGG